MSYDQVKELNLLVPYLKLLGYEKIEELIKSGTGSKTEMETPSESHSSLVSPPISTLSLSHISFPAPPFPSPMGHSNHSAGCPKHHPFLSIDPATHMILVTDPDNGCVYTLHPLQLQLYLDFDLDVRETHGQPHRPMPFAYAAFADILALANPETKSQYHLLELAANGDFTRVKTPFPKGFLPTAFVDPCLELLIILKFISKQGLVDKETIEDA
ncbi:hypothetical protein C0995_012797, partial [Termitomyces sp. Mi166